MGRDFRSVLRGMTGPTVEPAVPLSARFLTGEMAAAVLDVEPGLFQKPDGTVWLRAPNGDETQVGSGGSLPAQWTVAANGDLLITPTDASGIGLEVLKGLEADGANLLRLKATDALAGLDVNGDGSFLSYHGPDTIGFSVRTGAGTEIIFADPVAQTLGFFNHAPASRPVVPLTTPSVQNVIDALVALGLIVQHD